MSEQHWLERSDRWLRRMLWLYPADFRDETGTALLEAYRDRCREAYRRGGPVGVTRVCLRALLDSVRNGLGERLRPAIAWRRSGNWGRDTERALRRLVRAPAFTLSMLGTLTVGLGAFAVVYAIVDKVLIEPLPYDRPDNLYWVWRDYSWIDLRRGWLGGTDVAALQEAGGVIQGAAGTRISQTTLSSSGSDQGGDPEEIRVMRTTPNLFSLLGARPMIGRVFTNEEARPGRANLVVLTHDLWQRRFTSDRGVIGKDLRLSGTPYTVIGVMGPDFHFMRSSSLGAPEAADAYLALDVNLAQTNPGSGSYAGLVRVRSGTSPQQVSAAVSAVGAMVDRRDFQSKGLRLWPIGMKTDLVAAVRPALVVLGAAGVLLVLVLTINLANLLLVRAAQRDQEFAILRALGADQFALFRATLLEAGLLGLGGGVCGVVAAWWATRALVGLAPLDLPRRESIHLDWRVAVVVIAISTALGLLAGAVPAVWATRSKLALVLRNASVRGGGAQGRLRRSLVVAQVALSLVLLTAGGLVARSFGRLLSAQPGFDPSGVLTFRVPIPSSRYPGDTAVVAMHDRLLEAFAAIPGVRALGGVSALPLTADASQAGIAFPGAPGNTGHPDKDRPLVDYMSVTNGYFDAMKIRLIAGRGFSTGRSRAATRELLIDRQLAEQFFPKSSPLGFRVPIGKDTATIVGVFEQPRMYDVHQEGRPQIYFRDDFGAERAMSFALKTERTPSSLEPEVRAAVHRIDPQLAVAAMRPMDEIVSDTLRQPRVSAVLLAGFSLGALLLAAMGLYGVVAGSVNRRRHEMAIRLALGAERVRVLRLVLWEGVMLVLLGLVLGVPGIYLASHVLRGLLVDVSPFDPLTLAAVALGLAIVALLACYIPARRVVGIDPAHSLREG